MLSIAGLRLRWKERSGRVQTGLMGAGVVIRFASIEALVDVGLRAEGYGLLSYVEREREYPRSQEVAEACAFLGADGMQARVMWPRAT